jgi:hypothetical protein
MSERKIGTGECPEPPSPSMPDAHSPELAVLIPPPRDRSSAIRRHDLASTWAAELGELAAELVTDGKLVVDHAHPVRSRRRK